MTDWEPDWLALLRAQTDRFAEVVEAAEVGGRLDTAVTFCPGWSLHDLVAHLGGVHQWAAHAVTHRSPDLRPEPFERGRAGAADWYRRHASHLTDVLARTPSAEPAWTLDLEDRTAGFWRRRQVHETAMHVWDAEQALGEPRPIEPALAWDGVMEVAEVLHPRQVRLGRTAPLTHAVRLVATDLPGEVTIGDGEADEVRARADVLLRLLWHRVDPDTEPVGRRAVELLSDSLTP